MSKHQQPVPTGCRLTITLVSATGVRGSKGDKTCCMAKMHLASRSMPTTTALTSVGIIPVNTLFFSSENPPSADFFEPKDSATIPDTSSPIFEFSQVFDMSKTDSQTLVDALLNYNLVVYFLEVHPKEKTTLLFLTTFSLAPFIVPFCDFPAKENSPDAIIKTLPEKNATFTISITNVTVCLPQMQTSAPIKQNKSSNAKLTSVPTPVTSTTPESTTATFKVVLSQHYMTQEEEEKGNLISFTVSEISKLPDEWLPKDASEYEALATAHQFLFSVKIPATKTSERTVVVPGGLLVKCGEGYNIFWTRTDMQFLLFPSAIGVMRERALGKKYLHAEIRRVSILKPVFAGLQQKAVLPTIIEGTQQRYLKTEIDMAPLMIPDTTEIIGIMPLQIASADDPVQSPSEPKKNNLHADAGNTIKIKVVLKRPLIRQRKLDVDKISVHNYVPKQRLSKECYRERRISAAFAGYRQTLSELIRTVEEEYSATPAHIAQDRRMFMEHIQQRGVFDVIKTAIKPVVLRIVKEKHTEDTNQDNLIAETYAELAEELNKHISTLYTPQLATGNSTVIGGTMKFDLSDKELFAKAHEYEVDMDNQGAIELLTERTLVAPDNMQAKYLLASLLARTGQSVKARMYLEQVISINKSNIDHLFALGLLCSLEEPQKGECCFLEVLKMNPNSLRTLYILGTHYRLNQDEDKLELIEEEIQVISAAEMAACKEKSTCYDAELEAAEVCVSVGACEHAEMLFASHLQRPHTGPCPRTSLLRGKLYSQRGNMSVALDCIQDAINLRIDDCNAWAARGHIMFAQKQYTEARLPYETVVTFNPDFPDAKVHSRLALTFFFCSLKDQFDWFAAGQPLEKMCIAQDLFVRAELWGWAAIVCLIRGALEEAESALCHATTVYPRDPEGWCVLSMMHLLNGFPSDAEHCAHYALSLGLRNHDLLRTNGLLFYKKGISVSARRFLELSLVHGRDARVSDLIDGIK